MKLHLPVIQGTIHRRFLVNYRVKPEVVSRLIPAPFRPKAINDWAMAGICLIDLRGVRPRGLPEILGVDSRNAAHRVAVEWNENGAPREGVFIPRRDTDSNINRLLGGRAFAGVHHAAEFRYWESGNRFKIEVCSRDEATRVRLAARLTGDWPSSSVFQTLDAASEFFKAGGCGWSPGRCDGTLEGLRLEASDWHVEPLMVERVESSFFEDDNLFPSGAVEFDCALLMRNIRHEWHSLEANGALAHHQNRHGPTAILEMP